jgi:hypothetical protein
MKRNAARTGRDHQTTGLESIRSWIGRAGLTTIGVLSVGASIAATPATVSPKSPTEATLPLHERIDRLIEAKLERDRPGQPPAPPATDAEFLRRAWLDLAGMIPTAEAARAFVDDPSPYKRDRLVDDLLGRPEYARRMQYVFDSLLMERRADVHVPAPQWRDFLRASFADNVPYDKLVRTILAADGADPATRPAAKFALDREADPNLITRDVGRLFLGMDITCCQCHDHPLIDGYKQSYYYGIYAFLNREVLITDSQAGAVIGEKADGDVTFTSVFKRKVSHKTGPRVLDLEPLDEPAGPDANGYLIPPDPTGKVRPVPIYSRRARLAESLASDQVVPFSRNIVNRLWALMFGRGIVHPVDLHHNANPPSNPELLDLLTREFPAMKYDLKGFLRELMLTRAYRRSSEPPPGSEQKPLEPGLFAVAAVRALSPEQLSWSAMQGLGIRPSYEAQAARKLDGVDPRMRAILDSDAKRRSLRATMIETEVTQQLESYVAQFVSFFGGVAGQPQAAAEASSNVDQALYVLNGGTIRAWTAANSGWLPGTLAKAADPATIADDLYLNLLSRRPTAEERAEVAGYLAREEGRDKDPAKRRAAAIADLTWAIVASTEFRFNH